MRTATLVSIAIVFSVTRFGLADDLVIESKPEGQNFSHYEEIQGKWVDSRTPPLLAKSTAPGLTPPGTCGTRKSIFSGPNIVTTGPAIARFNPRLSAAGHYYVYATWPRAANAAPVYYNIKHARGTETRTVAQNGWGEASSPCNAGIWVPLGDYDFDAGNGQYVEVEFGNDVETLETRWYGQVYADAVRFSSQPLSDRGIALKPEAPPAWTGNVPPTRLEIKPVSWQTDLKSAWDSAARTGKNLMIFFYSPEADGTYFDNNIFSNQEIRAALDTKYIPVRINYAKDYDLANKLQVFRANTINFYDSKGKPLGQVNHKLAPEEFLTKLRGF